MGNLAGGLAVSFGNIHSAAPAVGELSESGKGYQGTGPCIVDGCAGTYYSGGKGGSGRGMCGKHYARWRRHGTAEERGAMVMRRLTDAALAWYGERTDENREEVKAAALEVLGNKAGPRFTKPGDAYALAALFTACATYAETPTEAEADKVFVANRTTLLQAARAWAKSRADYSLNAGTFGARRVA